MFNSGDCAEALGGRLLVEEGYMDVKLLSKRWTCSTGMAGNDQLHPIIPQHQFLNGSVFGICDENAVADELLTVDG